MAKKKIEFDNKIALKESIKRGVITTLASALTYIGLKYGLVLSTETCLAVSTFVVVSVYKWIRCKKKFS